MPYNIYFIISKVSYSLSLVLSKINYSSVPPLQYSYIKYKLFYVYINSINLTTCGLSIFYKDYISFTVNSFNFGFY